MSEKDHVVNTQITKFKQNWPRLTDGQRDLYFRLFYALETSLIPRIGDRLLDTLEYPPKQADIRKVENTIIIERENERQLRESQHRQNLPPLTAGERLFNCRMAHNISATIGAGFDAWLEVHRRISDECRRLGRDTLADDFDKVIEMEQQRRANRTEQPESPATTTPEPLPQGYVSLLD